MEANLSARELRDLIADSIAMYLKSYEVESFCIALGLPAAKEGEDPFNSKRVYVRSKLMGLLVEQLRDIAEKVAEELGDEALAQHLGRGGPRGVDGQLKNIIFASIGPKPRIVMTDAINNVIDVIENKDSCLIYDRPLAGPGLTWGELTDWWAARSGGSGSVQAARDLYRRLNQSLASPPEELLFRAYCKRYGTKRESDTPALLPQVYLHYDPYTRAERFHQVGEIRRERMDFLLLLPNRTRVVLEVDGRQHYSSDDGSASPTKYSELVAEDRKIRLRGYEVYRFGGTELGRDDAAKMLDSFFDRLLEIHMA